jgi:hypothetical protein
MSDKIKITLIFGFLLCVGMIVNKNKVTNECFPINPFRVALYIESYEDVNKCIYKLNDHFGDKSDNHFYLSDGIGYIGTKWVNVEDEMLFSFHESIGVKRNIKIHSGDWVNGEGGIMKMRNVQVIKMNQSRCKNEDVIHFKIRANIYHIERIGLLDLNVIFSNTYGFTGSFLTDENDPDSIISVDGEIYEYCLGFNNVEKRTIK